MLILQPNNRLNYQLPVLNCQVYVEPLVVLNSTTINQLMPSFLQTNIQPTN